MIKLFLKSFLAFLASVLGVADPMHNFQFAGRYYIGIGNLDEYLEAPFELRELFRPLLESLAGHGWWALAYVGVAMLVIIGIICLIRFWDRDYRIPPIYYVLYAVSAVIIWIILSVHTYHENRYFLTVIRYSVVMVFAVLAIFGGWGVRQCGMEDGKYHKNANRYVGQILLFPVWMLIIHLFWKVGIAPLIELSGNFEYHGGGFWRFVLGLFIAAFILFGLLMFWMNIIIPFCLKTAGHWPLVIMTLALWWGFVRVAHNWAYANFNGLTYLLILCLGGCFLFGEMIEFLRILQEMRCPMCHNCNSRMVDLIDRGLSYHKDTKWVAMSSDYHIKKKYADSYITDAKSLVEVTNVFHNWQTEHQCPVCGNTWTLFHSEQVGSSSRDLGEHRWTEHYR